MVASAFGMSGVLLRLLVTMLLLWRYLCDG
jgi:hypothetical protein